MAAKKSYLIDMDGVLVHGRTPLPGAADFLRRLRNGGHRFLILTNNSKYTQSDLSHRLTSAGIEVRPDSIFTSAMAAANFVRAQDPDAAAYVIGDTGLYEALNGVGVRLTDYRPNVVVLGEMKSYPYDKLLRATQFILDGCPFIATNPDASDPTEGGIVPACGAVAALLEKATGREAYFVGKPNPLVMRLALRFLNEHSENAIMVGDNMRTDIKVGLESGLKTILVLTGMTRREDIETFPYRPNSVLEGVGDIDLEVE